MEEKNIKVEEVEVEKTEVKKEEVKPTSTNKPKKSAGISVPLGKAGGKGK